MKILITGGAGFMGSDLVRKLVRENFKVYVVDKLTYAGDIKRIESVLDDIKFFREDITNKEALAQVFESVKPKVVIHYAAETHVDKSIINPDIFVKTNVLGTLNLLELSLKYRVKQFIHISTDEVYGELPLEGIKKFTEETPLKPNSPYSASKAGADILVRSFVRTYGLPAIIIRASNNYGPWQYPEKLIPLSITKLLLNKKVPIYGKGENIRTWLYVEDFTYAVLTIMEKGKEGEIYNVGSGDERKNIDVVRKIISLLGKDESYIEFVPDRPGHDLRYALDTTKIEKELGWKPKVSFEEGIERTVKWYIENKKWLLEKKELVERFVKDLKVRYSQR